MAAAALGTLMAIVAPVAEFEGFLYLIGSVFAPMAAILCVDCLLLRNDSSASPVNWVNVAIWVAGFILYRFSMTWDLPVGNTLPVMIITAALTLGVHMLVRKVYPDIENRARVGA